MKKLYRTHQFITSPDVNGISYFGLSDFALRYFVRFHKLNFQGYPKTNYSIMHKFLAQKFVKQTYKDYKQKKLTLAEEMQYKKIMIKKDQGFSLLQTFQYDLQLTAPVNMMVLQPNYEVQYKFHVLSSPYLFKVKIFEQDDLKQLMTQQQYVKSQKYFQYS